MGVLRTHADRSYDWECDGCGDLHFRYGPHRGPRRRLCKSCQNNTAYRARRPDIQRAGRGDRRRLYHRIVSRRMRAAGKEPHAAA